ncbi:MAG: hypothetical protein JKY34_08780 [Kordiimonadaceae bacterium]|nr:hypothetical protein [Kordiimonadaceae bacterium]
MAVSAEGIIICNEALLALGEAPITAASIDGSPAEQFVFNKYEPIVKRLLGLHRWRFATKIDDNLNKLTDSPILRFNHVYQAPADLLLLKAVYSLSVPIQFELIGNEIHTYSADNVKIEYIYTITEDRFSEAFREALMVRIMADMALGVISNTTLYSTLKAEYREAFATAKLLDTQSGTTRRLGGPSKFISAHRTGTRGGRGAEPGEEGYG